MRVKLVTLGMSLVVVVALVLEGLAIPHAMQENTNQSGATTTRRRPSRRSASRATTNTGDATAGETMTQNANMGTTGPGRGRRGRRRTGSATTGAGTGTTPAAEPTSETSQEQTTTGSTPAGRRRMGGRKGRRMMMSGVPSGVENCLNHLAQMASSDPLIEYEGHPSQIINNGLLWNDPKSKCAVTDPAQRTKILEVATAWRMKDAAKVRSLLSEMGATATSGGAMTSGAGTETTAPRRRGRRGSRNTMTTTPEAAPQATPETPAATAEGETNSNANRGMRRGRRGGRRRNANSSTANTNSGF